ncbi:hypothetical protein [Salisediminibacterium halotolerans]|uniref:Uncharacterized protein n=1 Tax=Salisediminibacterium halotolerans TaxID=517425 RepID=A0A1H9RDG4_9BACI|nr:hypothetical protein [Salisediminibacterium haloalkalitolerans]SER70756.1 hypothetical protein SAMN05444126_104108 [Salisediminibacterium haloalkalitolerans]
MSIGINFFPEITDRLIQKTGVMHGSYSFSYMKNRELDMVTKYPDESRMGDLLFFEDPNYDWNPDDFNLKVSKPLTLNNPMFLFGKNGVAPEDAELAIGVIWTCKDINLRGAKEIISFTKSSNSPLNTEIELNFKRGTLKKELNLETIVYVKTPGHPSEDEMMLGNQSGLKLGKLDKKNIVIEGNGSEFPVVEVADPLKPLWWIDCSWTDPQEDAFEEENLKLCINRSHKNYTSVYNGKSINDSPVFIEIMASALEVIIQKTRESDTWEDIKRGEKNAPGSIGEAVYYFLSTFEWDVSSPERMSVSIRKYLEGNM